MIDTKFRANLQPVFNKTAYIFVKLKIMPDTITIIAFVIGIISSVLIVFNFNLLGLLLLWISGLLDVLDGTVARIMKKSTKRGAYMDLIFDRMVEASIILAFYLILPEFGLAYILFFISVLFNFTTFIVAGALFNNTGEKSMHYDVGIAERTETFIIFSLMILFPNYVFSILITFDIIIFLTGLIRFKKIVSSELILNEHESKNE